MTREEAISTARKIQRETGVPQFIVRFDDTNDSGWNVAEIQDDVQEMLEMGEEVKRIAPDDFTAKEEIFGYYIGRGGNAKADFVGGR